MAEERTAFEALVREASSRLLALARLYLGDPHEAEDVVQDSLTRGWAAWDDPEVRGHALPWLYRVVRNRCIDLLRSRRRTAPLVDDRESPAPDEPSPAGTWTLDRVIVAIRGLAEPHRTVLLLRFSQKLPYDDIATITGVPVGTAKSQVSRALQLLRTELAGVADGRAP